jgi:cell division protein ZipA
MDLSVREWLVIIGALLAVAVLLDGYRRMTKDRRDTLRLSGSKRREVEDDLVNPELPGEVRVVAVREQPSLHMRRAKPEDRQAAKARQEPSFKTDEVDHDILFQDPAEEYRKVEQVAPVVEEPEAYAAEAPEPEPYEPVVQTKASVSEAPKSAPDLAASPAQGGRDSSEYQELFVLNVVADEGKSYRGADLLQILLGCDLRYGRMKIFHRHERADGSGEEQFSVANLVEPGNFELDGIEEFTTPGVVFFMNLPGPEDSAKAFDAMVETARCLVKNLGGEMRDQTHSIATKQTLEHYKQRIRDFERRQLTLM